MSQTQKEYNLEFRNERSAARQVMAEITRNFNYDTMNMLCDYESLVAQLKEHNTAEREWPMKCSIEFLGISSGEYLSTFWRTDVSEFLDDAVGIEINPDRFTLTRNKQ